MDRLLERSDELARIREHWSAVQRSGRGRLVLVSGEAGIGKTTLLSQLLGETRARTLVGTCDSLTTPPPLGPLVEIAHTTGGPLAERVDAGTLPHDVALLLLEELARRRPTVLVLEDVHWADGATLDVLRLVGRRVRSVPALVVATYRDTEIGRYHPLRQVLGELGSSTATHRIRLTPLSPAAVATLAEPHGVDPDRLYRATGGNAFFVTEILAAPRESLPESIRDAILARADRLTATARAVLEAVAVVAPHAELALLEAVAGPDLAALDECLAAGMLMRTAGGVAFRHELARVAVEEAVAPDRELALHRAALAALSASPSGSANLARLSHHAERAADAEAVLRFAPAAAARASALGAHREAAAQYARALRFAGALPLGDRAQLLQRCSYECYVTAQEPAALAATDEALMCFRELGDRRREGDTLRWRGLVLANLGRSHEAASAVDSAIAVLEDLPESRELATAYAARANLGVLAEDAATVEAWAAKCLDSARQLGDRTVAIGALAGLGISAALHGRRDGVEQLEQALAQARDGGSSYQVGHIHVLLGMAACRQRSLDVMERAVDAGLAYCTQHDALAHTRYLLAMRGWIELERGDWDRAAESVALALTEECTLTCLQGRIVLTLLRARRGDPDPHGPLAEARAVAERTGDLWWLWQTAAAGAECAWLDGRAKEIPELTESTYRLALERGSPWPSAELAWWRRRAGVDEAVPPVAAGPFLLQLRGRHRPAADAWRTAGCPYEAALALAETGREADLRQALDELHALGAGPAATIVARRLRERGTRGVPRGPHVSTRSNALGLTRRELDVLTHLIDGRRNGEIAERLFVSRRTVDHHVSAILRKLNVATRGEAAAAAQRLGLPKMGGNAQVGDVAAP